MQNFLLKAKDKASVTTIAAEGTIYDGGKSTAVSKSFNIGIPILEEKDQH